MHLRNTADRYGSLAKLLHWGMALVIFYLLFLGFTMGDLPIAEKVKTYGLHKSLGIFVLSLAAMRVIWRLKGPVPPLSSTMRPHERYAALITHASLYILMFLMPMSGWLMSSAAGFPVSPFGLFVLPDLIEPSKQARNFWHTAHEFLSFALIGLISLHILGAFYHHFYYRDHVLRRMLPFTSTRL